ncbi:MAG: TonB-dependent receptor [Gemmatimonadetes bacterium]|jgi:iron complex outermembrane receptor protein|nr:TonB-dependent receptor [Gemmatimonadota bacterium]
MRHPSSFLARVLRRTCVLALVPASLLAQAGSGVVAGRVTSGGEGVAGASVVAGGVGRGTLTRADGTYRLTLPAGRYDIRARLVGYASRRDSVTVVGGSTATLNFTLERGTTTLEAMSTIGTRGQARTVIDAPVPIDVLSAAEIKATGRTETAQMIQAIAPSFNFPRTSIGDGTDHVRPATLRGLAPDQTLVLVNGKRRHNSALVNVNGFVGRGSAPVDLNAIPSSMIDRIEILRDGAAAQYGSDAIAGVMNIVLKQGAEGEMRLTVGEAYSTYNRADNLTPFPQQVGEVQARDGRVFQLALDKGFSFASNGFLHLSGELRDRGYTNRSLRDPRIQYFAGDPRETNPALPSPEGRVNHRQGDAATHDVQGFWNAGTTMGAVELYSFGGIGARRGEAAGFWRRPSDDRTLRNLYPNGFLPLIRSDIGDASGSLGGRGAAGGWNWDLGTVLGSNQFGFTIKNTANASLGPTSKTEFDAGKLRFRQSTTSLDLNRDFKGTLPVPVNVAAGAEFRADRYEIVAGEVDSWRNGGVRVLAPDGVTFTTRPAAPGAQVFPGFKGDSAGKPGDAGTHSRSNTALYVDLSSDLTSRLLVDVASRYEKYSDFGSTTTGKLSARFQLARGFALRGAASTGFRAPSLMQEYFSSTATNFIGGIPFDIKTLPANSVAAIALGAAPLKAEKSQNYSIGLAAEPVSGLSFTADYYAIGIDDRIVLSNNFIGDSAAAALGRAGVQGVQGGRYFTNAVDTRTRGYDVIANYGYSFANSAVMRLSAAYNHNRTRVTRVDTLPSNLAGLRNSLFDRVEQGRIEEGNPENNLILSANYNLRGLGALVRSQRFGQVTSYGTTPSNAFGPLDQVFSPKWVTDVSGSYGFGRLTLTVGADNVLDVYPDRNSNNGNITGPENGGSSNFGIFPYNGISPFGFNGRFVYTRLSVGL